MNLSQSDLSNIQTSSLLEKISLQITGVPEKSIVYFRQKNSLFLLNVSSKTYKGTTGNKVLDSYKISPLKRLHYLDKFCYTNSISFCTFHRSIEHGSNQVGSFFAKYFI